MQIAGNFLSIFTRAKHQKAEPPIVGAARPFVDSATGRSAAFDDCGVDFVANTQVLNDIHAFHNLAENGIAAIQKSV